MKREVSTGALLAVLKESPPVFKRRDSFGKTKFSQLKHALNVQVSTGSSVKTYNHVIPNTLMIIFPLFFNYSIDSKLGHFFLQ